MSKLEQLYQEMADLTLPKCKQCRVPLSCCSPEYCEMAIQIASEKGITLEAPHFHPTLTLMGPEGCVAPPHLRPNCTLHVCSINNLGFDPNDRAFTKKYFRIRRLIEKEEFKIHAKKEKQSTAQASEKE